MKQLFKAKCSYDETSVNRNEISCLWIAFLKSFCSFSLSLSGALTCWMLLFTDKIKVNDLMALKKIVIVNDRSKKIMELFWGVDNKNFSMLIWYLCKYRQRIHRCTEKRDLHLRIYLLLCEIQVFLRTCAQKLRWDLYLNLGKEGTAQRKMRC